MVKQLQEYERDFLAGQVIDTPALYMALVGAHPGDTLLVRPATDPNGGRWIDLQFTGRAKPRGDYFWATYSLICGIFPPRQGQQLIFFKAEVAETWREEDRKRNSSLRSSCGQGVGAHYLATQVQAAHSYGFTSIGGRASEGDDPHMGKTNGYYTWPRLGFDRVLTADDHARLPGYARTASTLLDVIATTRGRNWWKSHGWEVDVDFDTAPTSRSMTTLQAYFEEKGWEWPSIQQIGMPYVIRLDPRDASGSCDCEKPQSNS